MKFNRTKPGLKSWRDNARDLPYPESLWHYRAILCFRGSKHAVMLRITAELQIIRALRAQSRHALKLIEARIEALFARVSTYLG